MNAHRLTVIESVVRSSMREQPFAVEGMPWTQPLLTDEQVYVRRLRIDGTWRPLDTGWLAKCSRIHVRNEEGLHPQVVPTQEEREQLASRVVQITFKGTMSGMILVRPGRTVHFEPEDLSDLIVRCRSGSAIVLLTVFPE